MHRIRHRAIVFRSCYDTTIENGDCTQDGQHPISEQVADSLRTHCADCENILAVRKPDAGASLGADELRNKSLF